MIVCTDPSTKLVCVCMHAKRPGYEPINLCVCCVNVYTYGCVICMFILFHHLG